MISFSCSDISWVDGLILWHSWNSTQCYVFHRQATIGTNIYGWNTINSILSIRTYINTSIILWPTILLALLSSTIFWIVQSRCIIISSWATLGLTCLVGITFAGLITCTAISISVARFMSTNNTLELWPSFNIKAFEMQQLYKFFPYMGSFIICPFVYNPICSSSNLTYSTGCCWIYVRMYVSFGLSFFSTKSVSPVYYISLRSLELFGGYTSIVRIPHLANHHHEQGIWQLWEFASRLVALAPSPIHLWSLVALHCLFPWHLDETCSVLQ